MKCPSLRSNNAPPETWWLLTCSHNTHVFRCAWAFWIVPAQLSVTRSCFEVTRDSRFAASERLSRRPALPVKMWNCSLRLCRTFHWTDAQMLVFTVVICAPLVIVTVVVEQVGGAPLSWKEQRGCFVSWSLRTLRMSVTLWLCDYNKVTFLESLRCLQSDFSNPNI